MRGRGLFYKLSTFPLTGSGQVEGRSGNKPSSLIYQRINLHLFKPNTTKLKLNPDLNRTRTPRTWTSPPHLRTNLEVSFPIREVEAIDAAACGDRLGEVGGPLYVAGFRSRS